MFRTKQVIVAPILAIILASIYFVSYSARVDSGDELRIFDGASSYVRYGDWGRDESLWLNPPDLIPAENRYPISTIDADETAFAWWVSWFYRVADANPSYGLVHVVWVFNIVVVVACAMMFYAVSLSLGYTIETAVLSTLLLGLTTLMWSYSKMLFREPIITLLLLCVLLSIIQWRKIGWLRGVLWVIPLGVAYGLAVNIKTSALFALPAFFIFLMPIPNVLLQRRWVRLGDSLLVLMCVGVVLLAYVEPLNQLVNQVFRDQLLRITPTFYFTQVSLHSYLFSVGGSLWGTSPTLLLGFGGVVLLYRSNNRRTVWLVVLCVVGYALGHAYLTGIHWFGGLSFPPRFLVPTIPIVMLLVLPIVQHVLIHRTRWIRVVFVSVVLLSLWIQIVAVVSFWRSYSELLLPEQSNRIAEWADGLNRIEYLRWVLLPQLWGTLGLDVAWYRANLTQWALANVAVASVGLVVLAWVVWRKQIQPMLVACVVFGMVLVIGINASGLQALATTDTEFQATNASLHHALDVLKAEARPNDVLLLSDRTFDDFIMNYDHVTNARPLILPIQPGEPVSREDVATVISNSTGDLLTWFSMRAIDHLAIHHERLWLLTNTSVYLPWSVRAVERYLAENYYLVREIPLNDAEVRLLEFHMTPFPYRYGFTNSDYLTDLSYGTALILDGFTLPNGTIYSAGDTVPIALQWHSVAPISEDYVISWFLAPLRSDVPIVQGMDSQPHAGFAPTTKWIPLVPVQDRRAVTIPLTAPSGDYEILVLVYRFVNGAPERLLVRGQNTKPDNIGVLPLTITIEDAQK